MKYIFFFLLLAPVLHVEAATYWIDSSFQVLTERKINELSTYASPIPDSIMEAKRNTKCFLKYETVKKRLISFDKEKSQVLETDELIVERDKYIAELDKKFIQPCLKKYGEKKLKSTSGNSVNYEELEDRITTLELQVKEIIKVLQSMGKLNVSIKG